jgi:hypothetical protein
VRRSVSKPSEIEYFHVTTCMLAQAFLAVTRTDLLAEALIGALVRLAPRLVKRSG